MTDRFRDVLGGSGAPVVERNGPHEQRIAVAVAACDALLARGRALAGPLG
jgi:hypothetical protein